MIDSTVDGINMVMEMDAIVHLGSVMVHEGGVMFSYVRVLYIMNPQKESSKSRQEKYTAHTITDKNFGGHV